MNFSEIPIIYWLMAGASVVVFWAIGIKAYPKLPKRCAIHWPLTSSQPDEFGPRWIAAFGIPAMATLLALILIWPAFAKSGSISSVNMLFSGLVLSLTIAMLLAGFIGMLTWNVRGPFNMHRFMKWVMGLFFAAVLSALGVLITILRTRN